MKRLISFGCLVASFCLLVACGGGGGGGNPPVVNGGIVQEPFVPAPIPVLPPGIKEPPTVVTDKFRLENTGPIVNIGSDFYVANGRIQDYYDVYITKFNKEGEMLFKYTAFKEDAINNYSLERFFGFVDKDGKANLVILATKKYKGELPIGSSTEEIVFLRLDVSGGQPIIKTGVKTLYQGALGGFGVVGDVFIVEATLAGKNQPTTQWVAMSDFNGDLTQPMKPLSGDKSILLFLPHPKDSTKSIAVGNKSKSGSTNRVWVGVYDAGLNIVSEEMYGDFSDNHLDGETGAAINGDEILISAYSSLGTADKNFVIKRDVSSLALTQTADTPFYYQYILPINGGYIALIPAHSIVRLDLTGREVWTWKNNPNFIYYDIGNFIIGNDGFIYATVVQNTSAGDIYRIAKIDPATGKVLN